MIRVIERRSSPGRTFFLVVEPSPCGRHVSTRQRPLEVSRYGDPDVLCPFFLAESDSHRAARGFESATSAQRSPTERTAVRASPRCPNSDIQGCQLTIDRDGYAPLGDTGAKTRTQAEQLGNSHSGSVGLGNMRSIIWLESSWKAKVVFQRSEIYRHLYRP